MRYMYLVLMDPAAMDRPPPQRLMDEMNALMEQRRKEGKLVGTGGLFPPQLGGMRVTLRGGTVLVTDGPFTEAKEAIGGYAIFDFATREEAVAAAIEFMELHRLHGEGWEGVCEMRPMAAFNDEGDCADIHEALKTSAA